ncbi:MAG: DUF1848 family protein, partial [Hyphomonadaceae bacterium]|nr:DUF1848 family protein [Clostridia bacterium]
YDKTFEPNLPSLEKRMDTFIKLSEKVGKDKVIWRYDPMIISNISSIEYHLESFHHIASHIGKYTNRVVISFVDFYNKHQPRWQALQEQKGIQIADITEEVYRAYLLDFAKDLKKIADKFCLTIQTCAEPVDLSEIGILQGACVDTLLINQIFNLNLANVKDKNQREHCLCGESSDMGMYNCCPHLCTYCYANAADEQKIMKNYEQHRYDRPMLYEISKNELHELQNKVYATKEVLQSPEQAFAETDEPQELAMDLDNSEQ